MFLLYVDESGDSGMVRSPSDYFVLTGLVIHELRWNEYLDRIVDYRKRMRNSFGLLLREEIHSAHLINTPGSLSVVSEVFALGIRSEEVHSQLLQASGPRALQGSFQVRSGRNRKAIKRALSDPDESY